MLAKANATKQAKAEELAMYGDPNTANPNKKKRGKQEPQPILRAPIDVRSDPKYEGETTIKITFCPLRAIDEKTLVEESTLRVWICHAMVEEDPFVHIFDRKIAKIKEDIQRLRETINSIPKMLLFKPDMKTVLTAAEAAVERQVLYDRYGDERMQTEKELNMVKLNKKAHVDWRCRMNIDFTKGTEDKNTSTCTWYVNIGGTNDALDLENRLLKKMNWPGINLACAGIDRDNMPFPAWAGRGPIPDGKKADEPGMTHLQVLINGAHIERCSAGVGLVRALDRKSANISAEEFGLYYGEFESGQKMGLGLEMNDIGVYTGMYKDGNRRGKGRLDLADGTTIIGDFGVTVSNEVPQSTTFRNPYYEGEPDGLVEINFGDGGYYKGQMRNGRITGRGDYQSAFNEVYSGTFEDGLLHGDKNFYQNYAQESYFGSFKHGEAHGKIMYLNSKGDSYDGYYFGGLRHGRGISFVKNGGRYKGYYVNGTMHGKGSIEYGIKNMTFAKEFDREKRKMEEKAEHEKNIFEGRGEEEVVLEDVDGSRPATAQSRPASARPPTAERGKKKEKRKETEAEKKAAEEEAEEKKKDKEQALKEEQDKAIQLSEFDFIFQGFVFGDKIFNNGTVLAVKKNDSKVITRMNPRDVFATDSFNIKEKKNLQRMNRINDKLGDMEEMVMQEIMKKKTRIFNQQKHHTKVSMYDQDQNPGQISRAAIKHDLYSKDLIRTQRLEEFDHEKASKKALVPRLRAVKVTKESHISKMFAALRPDQKELKIQDKIVDGIVEIASSNFEEVHERQRFLKYDNIWARAELAFANKRKSSFV